MTVFQHGRNEMLTRRHFLKTSGAGLASVLMTARFLHCNNPHKKPNILWIIADDMSKDVGCYGNRDVKTPHIDKLASEGQRFTHCFATAPTCAPMRSALITGMHAISIGAMHQRNNTATLSEGVDLFIKYLQDNGYYCVNTQLRDTFRPEGKTDYQFQWGDKAQYEDDWDWTNREPDQPFFAQVQISEPHRTFMQDPQNPVDPDEITTLPPYYPDDPLVRIDWAHYLEAVQNVDHKVGQVLEKLEKDGDAGNTIVFFFSDQGRGMPRDKQFLYDSGINIPLIIRWPQVLDAGSVNSDLISTIDFAPTCLALANVKIPEYMHGHPFLGAKPQKREIIFAARDRVDDAFERMRCVRTKRFKYIRNFMPDTPWNQPETYMLTHHPTLSVMMKYHAEGKLSPEQAKWMAATKPVEELYDCDKDPYEFYNLADDPSYQDILNTLRTELQTWLEQMDDKGRFAETDEQILSSMREKYNGMKEQIREERGLTADDYYEYWKKRLKPTQKSDR